jgi:hypothetical protein
MVPLQIVPAFEVFKDGSGMDEVVTRSALIAHPGSPSGLPGIVVAISAATLPFSHPRLKPVLQLANYEKPSYPCELF